VSTTTNSNQETVNQETDIVVDVAKDLENFGIAQLAVTKLIQSYPAAYIREKLEMAKGLVAAGSCLVSQNPAGWLRRAIEEDYSPPRTSARHRHRHVRGKKDAKLVQAETGEGNMPKVRSQQAQNVATEQEQNVPTEPGECPQNAPTHNRENNTENRKTEIRDRENETTWQQTLEKVQEALAPGEAAAQLRGTTLVQVTDTTAKILVPNPNALAWLERRLYKQIHTAMKGIVGKDLDLQFVPAV
jgi:hypothetical protein